MAAAPKTRSVWIRLQKISQRRQRGPMMWLSWPVNQPAAKKKPRAAPMLAVMNASPFSFGRMMASMRNTVLPVWLEAKQWKSGNETASAPARCDRLVSIRSSLCREYQIGRLVIGGGTDLECPWRTSGGSARHLHRLRPGRVRLGVPAPGTTTPDSLERVKRGSFCAAPPREHSSAAEAE